MVQMSPLRVEWRPGDGTMRIKTMIRLAVAGLVLIGGGAAAMPQGAPLAALALIEPGQWQLKDIDGDSIKSICVTDPRLLIQLNHQGGQCSRFVVADDPKSAVVHYTCPGAGHGRTTIDVESGHSIKLQTQGIAQGAPFDTTYLGRRIGACGN